ncbi:MAG: hypothetical protein F4Y60_01050 [Boseongicola sp. SB0664_bin_43]|uniref:Uncharacterized protein n=1 Tax=Boseongicola sp. SB0664_bin_43 TaxID=2604844 RepID=A0A6B0XVH2_9RHOB|nr:hypothetical protein [Boseongicola sp. SB0664_bin_43]
MSVSTESPGAFGGLAVRRSSHLPELDLLKSVLKFAGLPDEFIDFVMAALLQHLIPCTGGEEPGVPESSLYQGRKRGEAFGGTGRGIAAHDGQQPVTDELRDVQTVAFGGRLDLLPLGIGKPESAGAARAGPAPGRRPRRVGRRLIRWGRA